MSEHSSKDHNVTIEAHEKAVTPDSSSARPPSSDGEENVEIGTKLKGAKLVILVCSLMCGIFMVALDGQIIATAIPKITTEFDSLEDVSWYGTAFLLAQISLQPTFGRVYTVFNVKYTYLMALLLFEAGSVICATAPSSIVFIIGRAVAGIGSAAVFAGDQTIMYHSISLRQRPIAMSFVGSMFGLSSVFSPIIGGLITDSILGWRFCFWINLPFGALAALIIMWTYKPPDSGLGQMRLKEKVARLDFIGAAFLIGSVVCLLLALHWGGAVLPWSDSKVWGCLLGFVLLLAIFIGSQIINKTRATIPYHIVRKRSVALSCLFILVLQMSIFTHTYYIPIWFQAVQGTSASDSGIRNFPYGAISTFATFLTGYLMSKTGYYVPFMWIGSAIFTIGSGLFYTLVPTSPIGQWLPIEMVAGLGFGMCTQVAFFPVQNELAAADISTGVSLVIFSQGLGGALGLSIGSNIFNDLLTARLQNIQGINAQTLLDAGASAAGIRDSTPAKLLPSVLQVYNGVLVDVFLLPTVGAGLAFVFSLAMKRRKIAKEA